MPEVIFTGPAGRLEGRYQPPKQKSAPIAIILHPHPQFGGTMNNQIVYNLFYMFQKRGFTVLRFNFRSVGRSQGDSTTAPASSRTPPPRSTGCRPATGCQSLLGRRLILRRLDRHAAPDAPPGDRGLHLGRRQANIYDFSFLAPCPSSGLIIHG